MNAVRFLLFFVCPLFITEFLFAATYAEPESCDECHREICSQWKLSDHANSMAHASSDTVLANFDNVTFQHIGFDDILLLDDGDVTKLIRAVDTAPVAFDPHKEYKINETSAVLSSYNVAGRKAKLASDVSFVDLVTSTFDVKVGVIEKLRKNMNDTQRKEFDDERAYQTSLRFHRPGDIAVAQDRVVHVLRKLVSDGSIAAKLTDGKLGTTFSFTRRDGKFFAETDIGSFEVRYTLGKRPLQQYLVETERGRLQALPVAWDSVDKRWFHLYPKEQIPKGDPLHWTTNLQNWNRMCADCHTTNLRKNFDAKTKTYSTTFSEIVVGCQSCHGPCGKHVEVAVLHKLTDEWKQDLPKEVFSLADVKTSDATESCTFCHTRRRLLREGAKPPETPSDDWFVPELVDADIYYPDGQLLEEAFEYGSFMQSKMYSKGVGCTNCHEPHSLELRFQGNRLCTQCHAPSIFDTVKHHFHPNAEKPGTQCVECHFPQSTYMIADPRRDHSIRKPSPALTLASGVPNACSICHRDRTKGETLEWANDKVERWYADKRKSSVGYNDQATIAGHYALAIKAGRRGDPAAVARLLDVVHDKSNKEIRPVIRASALTLLGRISAAGQLGTEKTATEIFKVCVDGLADNDAWVRFSAAGALASQPSRSDDVVVKHITPLLNDSSRAVRTEAARILAKYPDIQSQKSFVNAKDEYVAAQKIDSDQAPSYLNLAVLEHDLASAKLDEIQRWLDATIREAKSADMVAEAEKTAMPLIERLTAKPLALYNQSIEIAPDFLPSRINLAMLYNERGDYKSAEKEFREALRIEPSNGNTAYSLALLLAEQGRTDETITLLKQASKNMESEPNQAATRNRVRYNLGLILLQQGKREEAEKELKAIVDAEPKNTSFIYALAVSYLQRGEKTKATELIDKLIKLEPDNPYWKQLKQ
ncbi:MAG: tetratricopeptide repeat protein [Planctomycetaceae bacterium]|jgi:predicted CXXCH cytochrome family protein|nr:tetratricopeptide repeat protein [Planctomycetaceae bacterium]